MIYNIVLRNGGVSMAKMYRIIPDTMSTVMTTGYLSKIAEDLLYKLGYICSCNERYFGLYECGSGMVSERSTSSIFFFDSPWSCVRALNFIDHEYSRKKARILEYDIPDSMVNASKPAFTNYTNWQAQGRLIPLELLQQGEEVLNSFDDELKEKLMEIAMADTKEAIATLDNMPFSSQKLSGLVERVNNRRVNQSVSFFKSNFITGKSMIITEKDKSAIHDVMFNKNDDTVLAPIMNKSNGILTPDNYVDYNFDAATHQYGPIYTF